MSSNKAFDEAVESAPVTEYRILVLPDIEPYEIGDAQDEEEVNAIIGRDGVWGYFVESRMVRGKFHTDWEHVDSCFGYLGNDTDYMLDCARAALPLGTRDVPVFNADEHGQVHGHQQPEYLVDALPTAQEGAK